MTRKMEIRNAKDGYVKDSLESRLKVSRNLGFTSFLLSTLPFSGGTTQMFMVLHESSVEV